VRGTLFAPPPERCTVLIFAWRGVKYNATDRRWTSSVETDNSWEIVQHAQ